MKLRLFPEGPCTWQAEQLGFDSRGASTARVSMVGDPASFSPGLQIHPGIAERVQISEQTALGKD